MILEALFSSSVASKQGKLGEENYDAVSTY
jgi:hypothetical protein